MSVFIVFIFTLSAQCSYSEVTNHAYLFCVPNVTHSPDEKVCTS